ncbi:hypothetical protein HY501_01115 [Candidatus Woesearchaeota archaeon]|nr:hypothetical protein [Candidatus Woesearchaeota archaeon]
MEIDDLVILGRSWPEPLRDGRYSVCVAGYSEKYGFIRLYPTKTSSPLQTWNVVKVRVERSNLDSRSESWKIEGSKSEWDRLDSKIIVLGKLTRERRIELLRKLSCDATEELLGKKRSLGIVKPLILGWELVGLKANEGVQTTLTGLKLKSKKHFPYKPYIRYSCLPVCKGKKPHFQQIMEWGVYMWFEKNKGKNYDACMKVFDNLRVNDNDYEKYFLVGNLNFKRKTFGVISVLRFKSAK